MRLIKLSLCLAFTSMLSSCVSISSQSDFSYDTQRLGYIQHKLGYAFCQMKTTVTNLNQNRIVTKVYVRLHFYDQAGNQLGSGDFRQDVHLMPGMKTTVMHDVNDSRNGKDICSKTKKIIYENLG